MYSFCKNSDQFGFDEVFSPVRQLGRRFLAFHLFPEHIGVICHSLTRARIPAPLLSGTALCSALAFSGCFLAAAPAAADYLPTTTQCTSTPQFGGLEVSIGATCEFDTLDLTQDYQYAQDVQQANVWGTLNQEAMTMNTGFTTLGVRGLWAFETGSYASEVSGSIGWQHGFGDLDPVASAYFTGGDAFSVYGLPIARDQAIVNIGWETRFSDAVSVGLDYTGQFGDGFESQNVTGTLSIRF